MRCTEKIKGTLCTRADGVWIVASGYGNFPLSNRLHELIKSRELNQSEGEVEATVDYGVVVEYHFATPFTDSPTFL